MEFKVVIDISERLENVLLEASKTLFRAACVRAGLLGKKDSEQKDSAVAEPAPVKDEVVEDVKPEPEAEAEQPKKTAKKKASKKAETAPVTTVETPEPVTQPESEIVVTEPKSYEPEHVQAEPANDNAEDPMQGMSLVDALQKLTGEIDERGLELSAVNARVRKKANELGLSFGSALQLIKAIGYVEARKIALGE